MSFTLQVTRIRISVNGYHWNTCKLMFTTTHKRALVLLLMLCEHGLRTHFLACGLKNENIVHHYFTVQVNLCYAMSWKAASYTGLWKPSYISEVLVCSFTGVPQIRSATENSEAFTVVTVICCVCVVLLWRLPLFRAVPSCFSFNSELHMHACRQVPRSFCVLCFCKG